MLPAPLKVLGIEALPAVPALIEFVGRSTKNNNYRNEARQLRNPFAPDWRNKPVTQSARLWVRPVFARSTKT